MALAKALSSSAAVDAAMSEAEAQTKLEKNPDYAFVLATSDVGTPAFSASLRAKHPGLAIVLLAPVEEAKSRVDPNVFAILDDGTSAGDLATTIVIACEQSESRPAVPAAPRAPAAPAPTPRVEVFDVEASLAASAQAPDPLGDQVAHTIKALGRLFRLVDAQEHRNNLRYSRHVSLILRATRCRPGWPGEFAALARSLGHASLAEALREKMARNLALSALEKAAVERADVATRAILEDLPGSEALIEVLDQVAFRYDGRGTAGGQNVRTGARRWTTTSASDAVSPTRRPCASCAPTPVATTRAC